MWDYHIHTKMCGHANGSMEEYVVAAIKKGLSEMGFSAHIPRDYLPIEVPREEYGMKESQLEFYYDNLATLKQKYADQIIIRTGLEIDYFHWNPDPVFDFIEKNNERLDYIIGSIHMMDTPSVGIWSIDDNRFDHYKEVGIDKVYEQYFVEMNNLISSNQYDIIAHLDLVKKFGYRHSNKERYMNVIEGVLDNIKRNNLTIEISTAGIRKKVKEIYPSMDIIQLIVKKEIPIVISSDAHAPVEVGYKFEETIANLQKLGKINLAKFESRKKTISVL